MKLSEDGLASNTRSLAKKEAMEHCNQMFNGKASLQLFPKSEGKVQCKALYKLVSTVLDKETGKMLEYQYLLIHPSLGPNW